ncbi:MAG: SAP domain-containing protein [Deltaproteobacteria bacterium]|jgi:ABC-type uncharacterized transport system substrate-binding protein
MERRQDKMQMEEIKKKAKAVGIKTVPARAKKLELVRQIQTAEGNVPCFGTANGYCDQLTCCFYKDCIGKDY